MYSYMSVFKASYAVTDPSARCRVDVECQSPITAHSTWHTNRYSILVRLTKACLCLPRKPKVFLLCVIDC